MVIGPWECHAYFKVYFEDRRAFDSGTDIKFGLLPPGFEHANFCMWGKRSTIKSSDFEPLKDMKDGFFPINLNAFTDFLDKYGKLQAAKLE